MKKKIGLCIAMTLGVIIAGAIAINTGINNQALAFDENSQLVEGEGNVAQHWHCENNQPVSVTVCPNPDGEGGTGGTSWHIYKTCKDQSDEWRSDAREPDNRYACHGPTTPRDLAGLSYPDGVVDVNDIYQQCADADWYVVFGYEATSGYHNQPNGQRDDTSMPGSVQIGPAKYNEGVAAFSEENTWDLSRRTGLAASPTNIADDSFGFPTLNSNAGSSSGYSDVLNNTHISELTAVSMFCGAYRTTTGKDDCDINTFKNSTGDNGMKGKGYFCVTDLTPNKVTIHIEKGDDGDKGETDCYGLSTGSEEAEIVDQSEQDTNSEKDIISWDEAALLESYTSDGWEIESVEGAEGATVNVAEGDAEVTYKLKKAGEEEGEEGAEEGESEGGEGQVGADK